MEPYLKALIESSEFQTYHRKWHSRKFNPFDVLQVADVEIRHSNVLAWLLAPDGTHGIGDRFLRAFVDHLTRRPDAAPNVAPLQRLTGFDKDNVEVRREDYYDRGYADITVGFRAERVLLVIENKVVGWYAGAEEQIKSYQETLRKKYGSRYKYYPGVLLTTSNSPEGENGEHGKHDSSSSLFLLSWGEVRGVIQPLLEDFPDDVRAFVKQYLDIINDRLVHAGDDLAEQLRKKHTGVLEKLQAESTSLDNMDEPYEPYRATIERWVEYFEERPRRLRDKVAEYLTQKRRVRSDIITKAGRKGGWQFLLWRERPSGEELGITEGWGWRFVFEPRNGNVTVRLGTLWESNLENPNWQRVWSFLQDTPIDPDRRERYPLEGGRIYEHNLLTDTELARPFEELVDLLQKRLDEFFGSNGDYERINRYFRCLAYLAHRPEGAEEPSVSK